MYTLIIGFWMANPLTVLLIFPLIILSSYMLGRTKSTPIYAINPVEGTGIVQELSVIETEAAEAEVADIIDNAVVQVLPEDVGTIHIVPVTRITLNRWKKNNI